MELFSRNPYVRTDYRIFQYIERTSGLLEWDYELNEYICQQCVHGFNKEYHMAIGGNYRPTIKPKVKSSGEVRKQDEGIRETTLTYDFLLKQKRGFLEPYWDVVSVIKTWLFQTVSARGGYSQLFAEARKEGPGSKTYTNASNTIRALITEYINQHDKDLGLQLNHSIIIQLVINEVIGMSILDPIWRDDRVREVYVNGPYDIQVESDIGLTRVPGASFMNQAHAMEFATKVLGDYNKPLDSTNCIAESRLNDGSRFEATHPDICPSGPNIDIRKHDSRHWTVSDICATGMASKEMLLDLERYIRLGLSALVIGGTSTGKTTVLNALTGMFPNEKRILTIEDTLELNVNPNKKLAAPLEARPAGLTGSGEITIRKLVKTALRLSPQIIIIGETRGPEAYDLVDAANTGHQVFSTLHANNATHAISRVEMAISQGGELVGTETLGAIQSAFAIIVEIKKFLAIGGKTRRIITGIHEVAPHITKNQAGEPELKTIPLWTFIQHGTNEAGEIAGEWKKVNELSPERVATIPDFKFKPLLTWEQLLKLENIDAKDRMFATDWEDANSASSKPAAPTPQQPAVRPPQAYVQQTQQAPNVPAMAPPQRPMVPPVMHAPAARTA